MAENLSIEEITGVTFAGIRSIALTDTFTDLNEAALSVKSAARALNTALDVANAVNRDGETIAEDHKVVEAAKAYAKAETEWLLILHGYLSFANNYNYNVLFGDDEETALLESLFPNG